MRLLMTEMRRALRRRAIRVLIALGLAGCVMAGVISFIGSRGKSVARLRLDQEGHPAIMTEWWNAGTNDGFLIAGVIFLILGAFFGGATVAGGEWKAGTITTSLTWEPRRIRLHAARNASAAILAALISFALQILFLASFLPSVFAHGTTEGVDSAFWSALVVVMIRTSLLAGLAAMLAIALATAARNTAFAVITVFAWMVVIEGLVRGLRPSWSQWLWGENVGTVMTWNQIPDVDFTRGPLLSLATLLVYCSVIVVAGAVSFQRRDITAVA